MKKTSDSIYIMFLFEKIGAIPGKINGRSHLAPAVIFLDSAVQ